VLQGIHYLGIKLVYWAVKIVTEVPDAIPVIGPTVVELLRGGGGVGQSTLLVVSTVYTLCFTTTAVFMLMHF
jgi:cytochrome b6